MDGEDGRLRVVRTREHDLELELVELALQLADALADLGVHTVVTGLGGQLEEDGKVGGLATELTHARYHPRQLRALADQLLGAAVVVPESRRRHLGVERRQARLL